MVQRRARGRPGEAEAAAAGWDSVLEDGRTTDKTAISKAKLSSFPSAEASNMECVFCSFPTFIVQYIKDNFAGDVSTLAAGGYDEWLSHPLAAVAGIVLADQFTR